MEMEQKFKSAITYAGLVAQVHTSSPSQSTFNLINNSLPQPTNNNNTNDINSTINTQHEAININIVANESTKIVPYICGRLDTNTQINNNFCIQHLTNEEVSKLRIKSSKKISNQHFRVIPKIS